MHAETRPDWNVLHELFLRYFLPMLLEQLFDSLAAVLPANSVAQLLPLTGFFCPGQFPGGEHDGFVVAKLQ